MKRERRDRGIHKIYNETKEKKAKEIRQRHTPSSRPTHVYDMEVHSVSHTRFRRRRAAPLPRRARTARVLRRCSSADPLRSAAATPAWLGCGKDPNAQLCDGMAIKRCHHIVAEVRATLELCRLELEGTRARWQSDRASNMRKNNQTLEERLQDWDRFCVHEVESEQADLRLPPCASAPALFGPDTSSSSGGVGAALFVSPC